MSKFILFFVLVILLLPAYSQAQSTGDPLNWTKPISLRSDNIFLLWSQNSKNGSTISYQKDFKYFSGGSNLPPDKRLFEIQKHNDSLATVNGNMQTDVAAGYFTSGIYENIVAAWEGPNQNIQIMVPHFDSTADLWSSSTELTVQGPVTPYGAGQRGRIFVRTGDFLGNGHDQFVLAFHGADSTIHVQVYGVDDSLRIHLIASINDEKLLPLPLLYARFSITTGDLNGDGKDEIIMDGIEQNYNGQGNWAIYSKIYELKNSAIIPEARSIVFKEPQSYTIQPPEFGCTAGKFTKDSLDQVALVCAANQSNGNNAYVFIYMLQASPDLSNLTYDPSKVDSNKIGTSGSLTDFSITSGDLNNEGKDELIYDLDDFIYVYSTDDSLNLTYRLSLSGISGGTEDDQLSYDFISTGILNQNENYDIIVAKDIYGDGFNHWFQLAAYGVNQDLTSDSLIATISTDTTEDNGSSSYYHYAIAVGAFDGGNFKIGEPQHTVVSNIVKPWLY